MERYSIFTTYAPEKTVLARLDPLAKQLQAVYVTGTDEKLDAELAAVIGGGCTDVEIKNICTKSGRRYRAAYNRRWAWGDGFPAAVSATSCLPFLFGVIVIRRSLTGGALPR